MELVRIVLTVPFMRHPAGLVFELQESDEPIGWDPDERVRERQSFIDKRAYYLPDSGKGSGIQLPASDTAPCPPNVFEGVDIRTGPCRITAYNSGIGPDLSPAGFQPEWALRDPYLALFEIGGRRAQGIRIRFPEQAPLPRQIEVVNVLHERPELTFTGPGRESSLDLSGLSPGFYLMGIACDQNVYHSIRFMKSFPLLVMMKGGGRYTTQETMY